MKKFLTIIALLFMGLMTFNSCETREACEINGTGNITIINDTGFTWVFDVDDLGQVTLRDGQRRTYSNVSAGSHRLYYYDDFRETWYYNTYTLRTCEDLEYTWTLSKKKSSIKEMNLNVIKNGKIETTTEFLIDGDK